MATIVERKRKNKPSRWQAQVRIKKAKPVCATFDTIEEALAFAQDAEHVAKVKAAAKHCAMTEFERTTIADAIYEYLSCERCPPAYHSHAKTIITELGTKPLSQLTDELVQRYHKKMSARLSNTGAPFSSSSLFKQLSLLTRTYKWLAHRRRLIVPSAPQVSKLFPAQIDTERDRRLSSVEEEALRQALALRRGAAAGYWTPLLDLALETAARQQELVLAEWKEFDLEKGLWRIPAPHTKAKKSRVVSLSSVARHTLRELSTLRQSGDARVFQPMGSAQSVSKAFADVVKKANLEDFHFHDLRHEAITRMVLHPNKIHPTLIMKMVGHESPKMLNRYSNLLGDEYVGLFG